VSAGYGPVIALAGLNLDEFAQQFALDLIAVPPDRLALRLYPEAVMPLSGCGYS
jgi:hypothetical protein